MRRIDAEGLDEPVIQRSVHVELKGTDGVCDVLYGVALSVGIVVHRVDAPLVSGSVVMCVFDAVHQRVTEHHIRMCHIYLGTKHFLSVGVFTVAHLAEKPEVLFHAAIPVRALYARLVHRAAACGNLFLGLVVDIGQSPTYHIFGPLVQLFEVIRSIEFLLPLITKPFDIFLYSVYIFGVLLRRVRVVVAKVSLSAVFLGN